MLPPSLNSLPCSINTVSGVLVDEDIVSEGCMCWGPAVGSGEHHLTLSSGILMPGCFTSEHFSCLLPQGRNAFRVCPLHVMAGSTCHLPGSLSPSKSYPWATLPVVVHGALSTAACWGELDRRDTSVLIPWVLIKDPCGGSFHRWGVGLSLPTSALGSCGLTGLFLSLAGQSCGFRGAELSGSRLF